MEFVQIEYNGTEENKEQEKLIQRVIKQCYQIEKMENTNLYVSVILTTPNEIKKINKQYRNIDRTTDVLSFPMFEKEDLIVAIQNKQIRDVLGDVIISLEQVKKQAEEYGHSFERELAYMLVHGFYHLMGYDHMEEADKIQMRQKEEAVLKSLDINRE